MREKRLTLELTYSLISFLISSFFCPSSSALRASRSLSSS